MSDLSKRLENLSSEKRELLLKKMRSQNLNPQKEEKITIVSIARDKPIPVSFAQARLWFHEQLEGANATYNMPAALHLQGILNIVALKKSLQEIINRHEILRTQFSENAQTVNQIILNNLKFNLLEIDLYSVVKSEQMEKVYQLATEEAQKPFDLTKVPLIRATLIKLEAQSNVLLLTMHHIISDGWSIEIFIKELGILYQAFCENKPSPLSNLTIQYADFSVWQRQWLQGNILNQQLQYWKQQLNHAPSLLNLPTDKPRPVFQSFCGQTQTFTLTNLFKKKLETLSQQYRTTLFTTLLTAFAVLLSRYSAQKDIIIGTPIANRNRTEIEPLIGFFVNSLPIRIKLENNPTFTDLLQQVRSSCLDGFAHQDIPFEKLVEELQPERNPSYHPLFQVMFDLQKEPLSQIKTENLTLSLLKIESNTAKFDLTLSFEETESELIGEFEYNSDLFESSTIQRMIGHFQTLIQNIITQTERPIRELNILTQAEQEKILNEWNKTEVNYSSECIHQLFEKQVEKTPNAIALIYQKQQLTYSQLNSKANQLAHYLISLGVRPETRVGISVERSIEMIIAILAILKSGSVYVPIDPDYPTSRLDYIINDAQINILLTQEHLLQQFIEKVPNIHSLSLDVTSFPTTNPVTQVNPNNLAYIIYTSGSTGQPKGVMIPHQAVVSFTNSAISTYNFTAFDKILQFATISFDAAVEEIYGALSSGATLVLRSATMLDSFETFLKESQIEEITVWDLPTAYWQQLTNFIANTGQIIPETLRLVIIGGEAASVNSINLWREKIGTSPRLFNTYGPTETTVVATKYEITSSIDINTVPIGKPLNNVQTYILDQYLQPVPIGVLGELHIGGKQLALGYLNRPELTTEKFISNPFSNDPLVKLYKTGDLARYLSDGNIEYVGRIDNQIKLRGFRIELGEIEAILTQHPQISESLVIVSQTTPLKQKLIAYLVTKDSEIESASIRAWCNEKLPAYMIPAVYVILDAFPLTPNGKINRNALPIPNQSIERKKPPTTPTEQLLALIWSDILNIENIEREDNFFELGGHSLLATQVISRIRQNLKVEIPVKSLFTYPTIEQLAQHITQIQQSEQLPPIKARERNTTNLPLSFAQARLWFLDQLEEHSSTYNMPIVLQITGQLNTEALQKSWTEIVTRHEVLRTNFVTHDGIPVQIIHPEVDTEINYIDFSKNTTNQKITDLISTEIEKPFNLSSDRLGRVSLINLGQDKYLLLVTLHHIISDGWSMSILVQELSTLYQAFSQNKTSPLSELPIQYADFAQWQREILTDEYLDKQLQYWQQQLEQSTTTLNLPTDYPRSTLVTNRGASFPLQINQEITSKLKMITHQQGVTLFMLLLSVFSVILSRYSGQTDLIIGSPIANRNRAEIEPLIGFFVNTLPLRINLENNPTFSDLLKQVRDICLDGYAHQDIPFEKLVEELKIERNMTQNPLFQVMFVLQNTPEDKLKLGELDLTVLDSESQTAKFDLTLSMEETEKGLIGIWEYKTDLFKTETIERLSQHFQNLLESLINNPQQLISETSYLSESEQQQILVEWNQTQIDYPQKNDCIYQLFEAQVEKTPDAVALVYQNQQLTYSQLNFKANQLAHYLISLGVRPETRVGISVERSIEMIIGLLAILKAGGAYVPLDPHYPTARLNYIIDDAQITILLTQEHLLSKISKPNIRAICLEQDWSNTNLTNPDTLVKSENLAYLIYTSGSTGQPKGVALTHQSLVNLILWQKQSSRKANAKTLQFAPISFDVSFQEIACTLCAGGTLVLINEDQRRDFFALWQLIDIEQIERIFLPFVALQQLAQVAQEKNTLPNSLKEIITAGEQLQMSSSINNLLQRLPDCTLENQYGPSESHVVTAFKLSQNAQNLVLPPIGQPIANNQIYILDTHLHPVPIGVAGELHIGGVSLARGYHNRPELTQEKFITHPFSLDKTARLYKTGDLARYLSDGNIEYLGRIDHQVKIRGFRIELGEIEAILTQHPQIKENVVKVLENQTGKQLVAYVVSRSSTLKKEEIR
ncbi:non-ribosomal peptide synthetase, partial [Aphanothece hegewaldii CCALA 016]